jgi:hypothetical protein
MPTNTKATNQYYGKYRECCVVAQLNKTEIDYNENYDFTEEEKVLLYNQSKLIANFIGDHKAEYLGNHTALESGDIKLDTGEVVEIKTVSNNSSGTYLNLSIYYLKEFGFNFKDYMEKYGLYNALELHFGSIVPISRKNNSPVSQKNSSFIRHNYTTDYEKYIVPLDKEMREQFTADLVQYFSEHPEEAKKFILDMLNKDTPTSKKKAPDRLIVLNYTKNTVKEIDLKKIQEAIITDVTASSLGFKIGDIRIAVGWQNGNALNNPTLRIYI